MGDLFPPRPVIPPIGIDRIYTYRGVNKDLRGKRVRVIGMAWPGEPDNPALVHVQVLKGKNNAPTSTTFGCDARWLAEGKELCPYEIYHNELARGNKNIKPAVVDKNFGLEEAEAFDQGTIWSD